MNSAGNWNKISRPLLAAFCLSGGEIYSGETGNSRLKTAIPTSVSLEEMKSWLTAFSLLAASVSAMALDLPCENLLPDKHVDLADAIFVGRKISDALSDDGIGLAQIEVLRSWKGPGATVLKVQSNSRWALELDGEKYYLFLVQAAEQEDVFWKHPCKGIVEELDYSGEYLVILGEPIWSSGTD